MPRNAKRVPSRFCYVECKKSAGVREVKYRSTGSPKSTAYPSYQLPLQTVIEARQSFALRSVFQLKMYCTSGSFRCQILASAPSHAMPIRGPTGSIVLCGLPYLPALVSYTLCGLDVFLLSCRFRPWAVSCYGTLPMGDRGMHVISFLPQDIGADGLDDGGSLPE